MYIISCIHVNEIVSNLCSDVVVAVWRMLGAELLGLTGDRAAGSAVAAGSGKDSLDMLKTYIYDECFYYL